MSHSIDLQSVPDIERFIPVASDLLLDKQVIPFPVYVLDRDEVRLVLFCKPEKPFLQEHVQLLTDGGELPVFIPQEFASHMSQTLSHNLSEVMADQNLSVAKKTERFHALSNTIMKSLFESPPDAETFIKTATVVSDNLSELLATGPQVIGKLNELRSFDYYTFSHSMNVTALTVGLYLDLEPGASGARMKEMTRGVLLHDIGKCDIPKEILNKKGKLDDEEWRMMKSHTTRGYEKLQRDHELSEDSRLIALHHHEAWSGGGYPHGLAGEAIPYTSRICKVCDVYDALTSKRSYKDKQSPFESLRFMKETMKPQFDYDILMRFIAFLKKVYVMEGK